MSQSQALTAYITTVVGVIVFAFAVITAIVVIWYLRRDTGTQPQAQAAPSAASIQRLSEKAVILINHLNDLDGKVEQLSNYANQKVLARQKNKREEKKTP